MTEPSGKGLYQSNSYYDLSNSNMNQLERRQGQPIYFEDPAISENLAKLAIPEGFMLIKTPRIMLPEKAIKLTGRAAKNADIYCNDDPSKSRRRYVKADENKKEIKKLSRKVALTVIKSDASKNSAAMTMFVTLFGGLGSLGWLAGPIGGAPGTSLGIGLGLFCGGIYIKNNIDKKIIVAIDISDHFANWRSKAIVEKVYPIFKAFLNADQEYADFMCPISQDLCSVPMLAPDGKTYDREYIISYINTSLGTEDDNSTHVKSPIRNGTFCKNDLVVNSQYCRDLIKKSQDVYKKCLEHGEDQVIKYGLEAVLHNTRELMDEIYQKVYQNKYNELHKLQEEGKITRKEREKMARESAIQWDFS